MKLRERIAQYVLIRHIEDSYWEPHDDSTNLGTAYFKINQKWLALAERIAGCGYKDIISKAVKENKHGQNLYC